jgi:copper homeostasis protein (lipoprotein)
MRFGLAILVLVAALGLARPCAAEDSVIAGTASYRERITLPPGSVFQAILEDVSLADAPAEQLGSVSIDDPGSPPFAFEIPFDPADIDPRHTYAVRAQVSVGRKLIFVSDTINPVLTRGGPDRVDIWMIKVGDTTAEATSSPISIGAHGLRLPASFTGKLPCADCEALKYRLNLWPDQVFHLRRVWEGKDLTRDSIGRWSVDPDQDVLDLRGAEEELKFEILGPDRIRLLARDGTPIQSDLDYTLSAASEFQLFEPHLPLRGMLTYVDDSARFTECLTGRDYPLVKDGDYEALEHAFLAAGAEAAGPIMASFDGGIVQGAKEDGSGESSPEVMVERFVGVWPGETCERALGEATLTNTYWKILRLWDTEVAAGEGRREPNLILREGEARFTATVGCNQVSGGYSLEDDQLMFGTAAATMMACPAPLDAWEKLLAQVLKETVSWRIDGQTLELLDGAGAALALFQAVYLY